MTYGSINLETLEVFSFCPSISDMLLFSELKNMVKNTTINFWNVLSCWEFDAISQFHIFDCADCFSWKYLLQQSIFPWVSCFKIQEYHPTTQPFRFDHQGAAANFSVSCHSAISCPRRARPRAGDVQNPPRLDRFDMFDIGLSNYVVSSNSLW